MGQLRVSVIVPAYNAAARLDRCLRSILTQAPAPHQVILINDGSTDATGEIARAYEPEVTYTEQENQGPGAARNIGLELADGELVTFLDADDYWLPGFLESCVAFLQTRPEAIAVSAGQLIRKWNSKDIVSPPILAQKGGEASQPVVLHEFFAFWSEQDHIRTGSCVIRRDIVEKAGHQRADLRTTQDLEYWGYLATFGPWGFVPKVLVVCDGNPVSAAQGWMRKHRARWAKVPSVEQWQERIVPRLQSRDWPGFLKIRGRLAQGYAHDSVLAGYDDKAWSIVKEYAEGFPGGHVTTIMRLGARTGKLGWRISCCLLRCREILKALVVWLIHSSSNPNPGEDDRLSPREARPAD